MNNILITRKEKNQDKICTILKDGGFSVFFEPLFEVKKNIYSLPQVSDFAIIITSANACRAIINSKIDKKVKIYALGKASVEELHLGGFNNIIFSEEKNAASLKKLILAQHDQNMPLIYFRGSLISLDFAKELPGFKIEDFLAYEIIENNNFSLEIMKKINAGEKFDHILVFSKNSGKILFDLIKRHNLVEYFLGAKIVCFSKEILTFLQEQEANFGSFALFDEIAILKEIYE